MKGRSTIKKKKIGPLALGGLFHANIKMELVHVGGGFDVMNNAFHDHHSDHFIMNSDKI